MSPLRKGMGSPLILKNKFKQAVQKIKAINSLSKAFNSHNASSSNSLGVPGSNTSIGAKKVMKSSSLFANILNTSQVAMVHPAEQQQ